MDVHNNTEGINYCQSCNSTYTNSYISEVIMQMLLFGSLQYLSPIFLPKYNQNGVIINPTGDPYYFIGPDGSPHSATHGINSNTTVIPTNQ